jgi:hypothetical protein
MVFTPSPDTLLALARRASTSPRRGEVKAVPLALPEPIERIAHESDPAAGRRRGAIPGTTGASCSRHRSLIGTQQESTTVGE